MKKILSVYILIVFVACTNEAEKPTTIPKSTLQLAHIAYQFPDSVGIRLKLIDQLDSLGFHKEALAHADTLLLLDSLNYGFWYRKALLHETLQDTVKAINHYLHAVQIYPAPDALLALANLWAEQKNEKCLNLTAQVKEMRIGRLYDAHCAFINGVFYARTQQYNKAITAFDIALTNSYTYMEAYIEKGLVYFDQHHYQEALAVFEQANTISNTYADGYYYQGRCYEMMGDKKTAIQKFEQSLLLDPSLSAAKAALNRLK